MAKSSAGPQIINKLEALFKSTWKQDDHKELRILVTGKTGEGKSTLVNGILGKVVAKEGASRERCTTKVEEYHKKIHGVPVTVFDSPGLQDATEKEDQYLNDMRKKCQNLSLVLYCTKMTNNRLKDEDKNAIIKLTTTFGQRFWEHAILVLTFANTENVSRRDERDEDKGPEPDYDDDAAWKELGKKRFKGRVKKWKDGFHKFLIDEVGVRRDIVERILVVPAGDHRKSRENRTPFRLPDCQDWFCELWVACAKRVKEMSLFFEINKHRVVTDETTPHTAANQELDSLPEEEKEKLLKELESIQKKNAKLEKPNHIHPLQLTDTPKVDDDTYTPKLRENIKKMNKEAWMKEQVEKNKREAEEIKQQAEKKRKELERQAEEKRKELEKQAEEKRKEIEREAEEMRKEFERQEEEIRKRREREDEEVRKEREKVKQQEEEYRKEREKQFRLAEERRKKIERQAEEKRKEIERQEKEFRKKREREDEKVVFVNETVQTHPHTAMDPIKTLLEELLAQNHTLQLTSDAPADETYIARKLQENIKKMDKETWVKEQEEKSRKEREETEECRRKEIKKQEKKIKNEEEEVKERERQEMKDVAKDGAMAKPQSVKELKKVFQSQDKLQPVFTPTKLRSTSSVRNLCHSTPPFPEIWAPDDHKEFKLLVTGKTGVGKSTLVNGLLGKEVAEEGARATRCTTEVTEYKAELLGVPVTVFDSPGLQDTTGNEDEYIADMKKKCHNLSLVLYCTKMTNNCLKDEDRYAILKLTAVFGQRFWEHAVLVLTFANMENVTRRDDRDEDEGPEPRWDDAAAWKELEKKRFEGRVKKWKEGFFKFLTEEVGVTRDKVEKIPAVPAGDHRITKENRTPLRFPDRENWFDEFWKACSLRMKGKNYQLRELEHNIEIQAEGRKRKELEKHAEQYKKIIGVRQEDKKKEKADKLDLLLDKEPKRSDLQRIFKNSAVHFKMIGTALDITVADLYPLPDATTNNLIKVFERWTESNKDVTWRKIRQVCEDYPEELGQAKVYLERFFESDRAHDKYF